MSGHLILKSLVTKALDHVGANGREGMPGGVQRARGSMIRRNVYTRGGMEGLGLYIDGKCLAVNGGGELKCT